METASPEFFLITESMEHLANKHGETYPELLNGLGKCEDKIFLCFSKVVLSLDHKKKKQGIKYLMNFLGSRANLQGVGVKEVFDCLLSLGDQNLSSEIVKEATPLLKGSPSKPNAIIFSVKLCSRFANDKILSSMLDVLEKSMKGYFNGHYSRIEQEICEFLGRVKDPYTIRPLMCLLKMRPKHGINHIDSAIANILDAHQYRVDDVLDMLYDQRDRDSINAILKVFNKMNKSIDARKLLAKIRSNWWKQFKFSPNLLRQLLVKGGEKSKPPLFELSRQKERLDFALGCLKEIGVSRDEIATIFPKPPLMRLYNFFYKQKNRPTLDQIWAENGKLGNPMKGTTDKLEHLILHIFSGFNFSTINVAPLKLKAVDLACFYPETLDLFIIGCTTGTMENDLQKMNSTIKKMKEEMADLFSKCSVTPIVVYSERATIPQADLQYATQNRIVIIQRTNIDDLLEMLNTNRQGIEAIKYIKTLFYHPSIYPAY